MPRFLYTVGNDSKVIPLICARIIRGDSTDLSFSTTSAAEFLVAPLSARPQYHAGFTGDDHQRGGLFTRDNLLQHSISKALFGKSDTGKRIAFSSVLHNGAAAIAG